MVVIPKEDIEFARYLFGEHYPKYEQAVRENRIEGLAVAPLCGAVFFVYRPRFPESEKLKVIQDGRFYAQDNWRDFGEVARVNLGVVPANQSVLLKREHDWSVASQVSFHHWFRYNGTHVLVAKPEAPVNVNISQVMNTEKVAPNIYETLDNLLFHARKVEEEKSKRKELFC